MNQKFGFKQIALIGRGRAWRVISGREPSLIPLSSFSSEMQTLDFVSEIDAIVARLGA